MLGAFIESIADLLQEVAVSIAFRLSQKFRFPVHPWLSVLIEFLMFALLIVPIFISLLVLAFCVVKSLLFS